MQRVIVALALVSILGVVVTYQCVLTGHVITTIASVYDILYTTQRLALPTSLTLKQYLALFAFVFISILFNERLYLCYLSNASSVLWLVFVSQASDAIQYAVGRMGTHYIGWVSPRKTWEGYLGGYVFVLLLGNVYQTMLLYLLCVLGGLGSSLIKRTLVIKDYSNLLGSHGGWMDRVDSLVLPILFFPWTI